MNGLLKVQGLEDNNGLLQRHISRNETAKIAQFLSLFRDPDQASKEIPKNCMASFVTKLVKEAVNHGGTYSTSKK